MRNTGPQRVVCKRDSRALIKQSWKGRGPVARRHRKRLSKLMRKCRYRDIQQAVDAARTGDRILIMPGLYSEEPSRKIPVKDPKCAGDEYWEPSGDNHTGDGRVPTFMHQVDCPNARNLIAMIGDSILTTTASATTSATCRCRAWEARARCDHPGRPAQTGRHPRRPRRRLRAAQRDLVEQGGYNNVDLVETNGFSLTKSSPAGPRTTAS